MADEQDRAEAVDEDKGPFEAEGSPGLDVLDQTADADPGVAEAGRSVIDDDESGDALDGIEADADNAPDTFHVEEPPAEVAAMHLIDEP